MVLCRHYGVIVNSKIAPLLYSESQRPILRFKSFLPLKFISYTALLQNTGSVHTMSFSYGISPVQFSKILEIRLTKEKRRMNAGKIVSMLDNSPPLLLFWHFVMNYFYGTLSNAFNVKELYFFYSVVFFFQAELIFHFCVSFLLLSQLNLEAL